MDNYQIARNKLFPSAVTLAAQQAQKETGCLSSVCLAQWALESGYGSHLSGLNNPFGIKYFSGMSYSYTVRRTQEYLNGQWITIEAKFINFPTIEEAFHFHGKLIVNPQGIYANAYQYRSDWQKFIPLMAKHYATDNQYAAKLIELIQHWSLADFDQPA